MERLKDKVRDNNVDATRSTMQKRINGLQRAVSCQMTAAQRKNRKIRQLRGFINRLIASDVIKKHELKIYLHNGKNHTGERYQPAQRG